MAACSFLHHYPSTMMATGQYGDIDGGRRGSSSSYIRDEMVFGTPRCGTPSPRGGIEMDGGAAAVKNHLSGGGSPAERRASLLQEYFKSTNALNRSIMLEKSTVESSHGHSWTGLSDSKRDEMLDKHFVPSEVREQYGENGLQPNYRRNTISRLASSPAMFLSQENHYETINDVDTATGFSTTLSQPAALTTSGNYHFSRSSPSKQTPPNNRTQQQKNNDGQFSRNKLMSFSMRSKKVSPVSNRRKIEPSTEFLPLFEREVHDIDNEIDLPDEALLNDHVDSTTFSSPSNQEESFTRLRPLRYSFGRKLKHKTSGESTSQSSTDLTIFSNMSAIDSPSLQDLRLGSSSLDLTDGGISSGSNNSSTNNDYSSHNTQSDPHVLLSSSMSSDDNASVVSSSRQSLNTPDLTTHFIRGKSARLPSNNHSINEVVPPVGFKHPLSRSVRAGSTYVTVTSDMADRRHLFRSQQMKRKVKSENNTRENTPVPSETDPSNTNGDKKQVSILSPPPPIIRTEGEEYSTSSGNVELVSPMCSPPASPAAHGPPGSKRESGYISSYGENEASDDEEMPSRSIRSYKAKKRTSRIMTTTSSNNTSNNRDRTRHYLH